MKLLSDCGFSPDDVNDLFTEPMLRLIFPVVRNHAFQVAGEDWVIALRPLVLPVLRHVRVGTHLTVAGIIDDLRDQGYSISESARTMLRDPSFPLSTREETVSVVGVSNEQLGRPDGCSRRETYQLGLATGALDLCEPELAVQLRRKYPHQEELTLLVAMNPFYCADGVSRVFKLGRTSGLAHPWLDTDRAEAEDMDRIEPGARFYLFRRRKQPAAE